MISLVFLIVPFLILLLWRRQRALKSISNHPGVRPLLSPMSTISLILPRIPYISLGFEFTWRSKHDIFKTFKSDVISCVSFFGGKTILYLADAELTQKINLDRGAFPKPVEEYTILGYFGPNLVISEGHSWRRQQRISAPAFTTESYALLWQESRNIINDMIATEDWESKGANDGEIYVPHTVDITLRFALLAIARAGFGIPMTWADDPDFGANPSQEALKKPFSIQQALHIVAKESVLKMSMPTWMTYLPFRRLRTMRKAFNQLEKHIKDLIVERKRDLALLASSPKSEEGQQRKGQHDIFYNLIQASVTDKEEGGLTDDELTGNIYIFLLAGHETTAHTLAFTLALLALYPDEQELLYQHVREIMPEDGETTIDDYKRFDRVRAVYFETLRLFPPVQMIPKVVSQDTVLLIDETNERNVEIGLQAQEEADWKKGTAKGLRTATPPPVSNPSPSIDSSFVNVVKPDTEVFSKKVLAEHSPFIAPPPSFKTLSKNVQTGEYDMPRNAPGQKRLVVEKGAIVFVDPPAVHYNPKYYPDPHAFKPDRFMGDYNRAAFIPFSTGTRACIGRHFSEVESTCMLAHLINDYSVHPVFRPGETHAQLRERLSRASPRITLTPHEIPLIFKRRNSRREGA